MSKTKVKPAISNQGKWMRLLIPTELHTKIRIDGITEKKNLDVMVLKYLQLGYEASHNGYKGRE